MYNYKIFTHLSSDCEKILKNMENDSFLNFFQSYEFLRKLIKKSENKVNLIVIFKENTAIAFLPFEIKKYFIFNVLQWLGTNYGDYCNPILSKNLDTLLSKNVFLELWNRILQDLGKLDLIFFNNQLSEIETASNPFVSYFSSLSFTKVYQIDLKKIIKIKKNYLNQKKIKNSFTNNYINLYEELIREKNIRFVNIHLKIQDKTISSCLGIIYKEVFYYYIPTVILGDFNKFKPGKILILEIIEWCIQNNIKRFDFGMGNEKYKKYFSNKEVYLSKHLSYHSVKGFILYLNTIFFLKIKKLWL